jgi:hypothetical protein
MTDAQWVMPTWMEKYSLFIDDVGLPSEELMNDTITNPFNNIFRYGMIVAVQAQVALLTRLHENGTLP